MYYHNMGQAELGKFGFKKIRRAVKSVTKPVAKLALAPMKIQASMWKSIAKSGAKAVGGVAKVAGGLVSSVIPGMAPGGAMPYDPTMPMNYPQAGYGADTGYGSGQQDSGVFAGMSPLMLAGLVGVPVLLFVLMKKK